MSDDQRFQSLGEALKNLSAITRDRATLERMLLRAVMVYPHLLRELLGISHEQIAERCRAYIRAWAQQQQQLQPRQTEHAAPQNAHRSETSETAAGPILPSLPARRAVDPARKKNIRSRDAKAQLVRDLVQSSGKSVEPAAATRAARQTIDAALAVARRVFEERVVASVNVKWGDLTLAQLDHLELNVPYLSEVRDCLRELRDAGRFPDATTPLRDVVTPQEMQRIIDRCNAKREAAIHALEALRLTHA